MDGWMDNHRKDGLEMTLKVMIDSQGTNMLMKIKSFGMKAFAKCIKFNKLPTTSYMSVHTDCEMQRHSFSQSEVS